MKKQILLVDDSLTTRKLISLYLKTAGYTVITANNGVDALEKLAKTEVDLIITDLNMPQMDGLELVRSIRDYTDYLNLPIIVLTTQEEKRGKIIAETLAYLCKPISQKELVDEVKRLLKDG